MSTVDLFYDICNDTFYFESLCCLYFVDVIEQVLHVVVIVYYAANFCTHKKKLFSRTHFWAGFAVTYLVLSDQVEFHWSTASKKRSIVKISGAIHNPRNVKPQTHQTLGKHNQDTSNLRHIKPQTKNIGLSTTPQMKIPFL